jgi:hypothetical protein
MIIWIAFKLLQVGEDYHKKRIARYGYIFLYIIIIIRLLMSTLLGTNHPYGLHKRRTGHNPPRGPSADWWVLTTANAAGTNSLTCLRKHA